jgi:signal transduction histidine kinase
VTEEGRAVPSRTGIGRSFAAVAVAIVAVVPPIVLMAVVISLGIEVEASAWGLAVAGASFGLVGAVIIARVPGNRLGWVFGGISVALVLSGFQSFGRPLVEAGVSVSWVAIGQVFADASFTTMLFLLLVIAPSWFPTGRPLSRRWGWPNIPAAVAWGATVAMALFAPEVKIWWNSELEDPWRVVDNPIGFAGVPDFQESPLAAIAVIVMLVAAVVAVVSLVIRYRRSDPVERTQIRSLVAAFLFLIPVIIVAAKFGDASTGVTSVIFEVLFGVAVLTVPLAAGLSILKYRLYGVDLIISKAVTYGVLAVFITAVYVSVVVGIGSLFGRGDEPNLALSITAVAIVAVAFEPLRRRVQRWANVLVYGRRATPYEVLANATARLSDTSDPDEVLARVTQLVADGTGASAVVLWLTVGDEMDPRASAPVDAIEGLVPVGIAGDLSSTIPGDATVAIRHRGEVLGALSITKERGDAVTGADEKVLADVAAGAGVLLRNLGLNAELAQRAEQLRVSRRRLVAAHDAERHRLERDLHDGAQQQVVALKVKLGIARTLAEREGAAQLADLVAALSDTTQAAVDEMREVAHGIYPPLLEAEGLAAAIAAATRKMSIPVGLETTEVGRFERPIEETMYFAAVGALTEAADSGAASATISLSRSEAGVEFVIRHDGRAGELTAVTDRLDALGGRLTPSGHSGRIEVVGWLPNVATSELV